jgi:hypothetical protein
MHIARIEQVAVRFAVSSLVAVGLAGTLGLADAFLDWDLLDPPLQKVASLLIAWLALVFGGAAALALLLGHLRIADALERIGDRRSDWDRSNSGRTS